MQFPVLIPRSEDELPDCLPDYLSDLNPEQRRAVQTLVGPVLVLAGAGTGKTRVLVARTAHILFTHQAYPSQILLVTFTNKAAQEMKNRIVGLCGDVAENLPWLGTFHAMGAKILRRYANLLGINRGFSIIDTDDRLRLLKSLISEQGIDNTAWPVQNLASCLDDWKNRGLLPKHLTHESDNAYAGRARALYTAYQEKLRSMQAIDFGDILLLCLSLFKEHPNIVEKYRQQFRFIMVDEYQDTNTAQYLWLRMLTRPDSNLCCAGDDDQAIYGWRGADVDHILRFSEHFPGTEMIRLERNYRSTAHILSTASGLVAHNNGRLGKDLYAATGTQGEKVHVFQYLDDEQEAQMIADRIDRRQKTGDHQNNDIAILVRAAFQMRGFEANLSKLGIAYRVVGGPRFHERSEIRDAVAYLKLLVTPENDLAFQRIINLPRRGLGKVTIQSLQQYARAHNIPLMEAARQCCKDARDIPPKQRRSLSDLLESFDRWQSALDQIPHQKLAQTLLKESGYIAMWQNDKSLDAPGRLENLKELIRSMENFNSLTQFLEHISLVMDIEPSNEDQCPTVNIMTLHAAKGLEFNTVFLPGWEEGLFPHQRSLDAADGEAALEEERRLAYVGLTRARRLVHISFAHSRRLYGSWQYPLRSRFINELPEDHITIHDPREQTLYHPLDDLPHPVGTPKPSGPDRNVRSTSPRFRQQGQKLLDPHAEIQSLPGDIYKIGTIVIHQKFGKGKITDIGDNGVFVAFDRFGSMLVLASDIQIL